MKRQRLLPARHLLLAALLVLLGGTMGCDSLLDDERFTTDPNAATNAPAELNLTGAQVASILFYEGNAARIAGIWGGYFTGADRQYINIDNYETTSGDFDDVWGTAYAGVIAQTRVVQENARSSNNRYVLGIAQIMDAQASGTVSSVWGDVPYTQAANEEEFPNPAYDPQEDIYSNIQDSLDAAIANLESGAGVSPGEQDVFYGGDSDLWIAAAHTLKARFHLHAGNYAQAADEAEVGLSGIEENMLAPHGGTYLGDVNVYYSFLEIDRVAYLTAEDAYLVGLLNPASEDYRGGDDTVESTRFGFYYFNSPLTPAPFDPNTRGGLFSFSNSFPLLTYEENQLILAEARARTGDDEGAVEALNSVRQANAAEYDTTYSDYSSGDFDGTDELLDEILEEKYIALYGQIEGWTDVRRTDNRVGVMPEVGNELPQRFLYPQDEINSNTSTPDAPELFDAVPLFAN